MERSPESGESAGLTSREHLKLLLKRAAPQDRAAQNSQGPVHEKMLKIIWEIEASCEGHWAGL